MPALMRAISHARSQSETYLLPVWSPVMFDVVGTCQFCDIGACQVMMKKSLERRYRLLPYLYTLFYSASVSGVPVARSLVMEFAHELLGPGASFPFGKGRRGTGERRQVLEHLSTDSQFMLGPGLCYLPTFWDDRARREVLS